MVPITLNSALAPTQCTCSSLDCTVLAVRKRNVGSLEGTKKKLLGRTGQPAKFYRPLEVRAVEGHEHPRGRQFEIQREYDHHTGATSLTFLVRSGAILNFFPKGKDEQKCAALSPSMKGISCPR
jgi:hypothetical protein